MIIVNGWKPLIIITKHSILNAAAALDPSLVLTSEKVANVIGMPSVFMFLFKFLICLVYRLWYISVHEIFKQRVKLEIELVDSSMVIWFLVIL